MGLIFENCFPSHTYGSTDEQKIYQILKKKNLFEIAILCSTTEKHQKKLNNRLFYFIFHSFRKHHKWNKVCIQRFDSIQKRNLHIKQGSLFSSLLMKKLGSNQNSEWDDLLSMIFKFVEPKMGEYFTLRNPIFLKWRLVSHSWNRSILCHLAHTPIYLEKSNLSIHIFWIYLSLLFFNTVDEKMVKCFQNFFRIKLQSDYENTTWIENDHSFENLIQPISTGYHLPLLLSKDESIIKQGHLLVKPWK